MAFPDSFLEELRNRLPLSGVIGRSVRLSRKGREFSGLCPFHNEKSPSFTVNDEKGFFHCFGCGAHGDVISYVMRSQGLSFPEAVEALASEAGLAVPKVRPEDRSRAERGTSLVEVLEEASKWYQTQLFSKAGDTALDYLRHRGLTEITIQRYRLGYAPKSRTALKEAMLARGISEQALIDTGMLIKPDDGGETYDRFRNRIMFPIGDRRARTIAFGGRAMDANSPAKYLNSPDTELFHKGHNLYNHSIAREAAREAGTIIVVEGYMDVIALGQAGYNNSVAPLGTALTEAQMEVLWRIANEPILCFDGDAAGRRAAQRAAERCLPILNSGRTFRFAHLPDGKDPDDFIKEFGKPGMEAVISSAKPLSDILWQIGVGQIKINSAETRASSLKNLKNLTSNIKDENLKKFFENEFFVRTGREFFSNIKKDNEQKRLKVVEGSTDNSLLISLLDKKDKQQLSRLVFTAGLAILNHARYLPEHLTERVIEMDSMNDRVNRFCDESVEYIMKIENSSMETDKRRIEILQKYSEEYNLFFSIYDRYGKAEDFLSSTVGKNTDYEHVASLVEHILKLFRLSHTLRIEKKHLVEYFEESEKSIVRDYGEYVKHLAHFQEIISEEKFLSSFVGSFEPPKNMAEKTRA